MKLLLRWCLSWFASYYEVFAAIIQQRQLLIRLMWREAISRTSGTGLGIIWLFVQPALQVLTFWFLLDYILKVRLPGNVPFLEYFLVAMLPWQLVQDSLSRSLGIFSEYSSLYQRTIFPTFLLPCLPLVVGLLVYAPIYAVVSAVLTSNIGSAIRAIVAMGLLALWLFPFCYLLAVLGLFIRELRQLAPFGITIILYATPILYTPAAVPESITALMQFNVMADVIALHEWNILGSPVDQWNVVRPLSTWLLMTPVAWRIFQRVAPYLREGL